MKVSKNLKLSSVLLSLLAITFAFLVAMFSISLFDNTVYAAAGDVIFNTPHDSLYVAKVDADNNQTLVEPTVSGSADVYSLDSKNIYNIVPKDGNILFNINNDTSHVFDINVKFQDETSGLFVYQFKAATYTAVVGNKVKVYKEPNVDVNKPDVVYYKSEDGTRLNTSLYPRRYQDKAKALDIVKFFIIGDVTIEFDISFFDNGKEAKRVPKEEIFYLDTSRRNLNELFPHNFKNIKILFPDSEVPLISHQLTFSKKRNDVSNDTDKHAFEFNVEMPMGFEIAANKSYGKVFDIVNADLTFVGSHANKIKLFATRFLFYEAVAPQSDLNLSVKLQDLYFDVQVANSYLDKTIALTGRGINHLEFLANNVKVDFSKPNADVVGKDYSFVNVSSNKPGIQIKLNNLYLNFAENYLGGVTGISIVNSTSKLENVEMNDLTYKREDASAETKSIQLIKCTEVVESFTANTTSESTMDNFAVIFDNGKFRKLSLTGFMNIGRFKVVMYRRVHNENIYDEAYYDMKIENSEIRSKSTDGALKLESKNEEGSLDTKDIAVLFKNVNIKTEKRASTDIVIFVQIFSHVIFKFQKDDTMLIKNLYTLNNDTSIRLSVYDTSGLKTSQLNEGVILEVAARANSGSYIRPIAWNIDDGREVADSSRIAKDRFRVLFKDGPKETVNGIEYETMTKFMSHGKMVPLFKNELRINLEVLDLNILKLKFAEDITKHIFGLKKPDISNYTDEEGGNLLDEYSEYTIDNFVVAPTNWNGSSSTLGMAKSHKVGVYLKLPAGSSVEYIELKSVIISNLVQYQVGQRELILQFKESTGIVFNDDKNAFEFEYKRDIPLGYDKFDYAIEDEDSLSDLYKVAGKFSYIKLIEAFSGKTIHELETEGRYPIQVYANGYDSSVYTNISEIENPGFYKVKFFEFSSQVYRNALNIAMQNYTNKSEGRYFSKDIYLGRQKVHPSDIKLTLKKKVGVTETDEGELAQGLIKSIDYDGAIYYAEGEFLSSGDKFEVMLSYNGGKYKQVNFVGLYDCQPKLASNKYDVQGINVKLEIKAIELDITYETITESDYKREGYKDVKVLDKAKLTDPDQKLEGDNLLIAYEYIIKENKVGATRALSTIKLTGKLASNYRLKAKDGYVINGAQLEKEIDNFVINKKLVKISFLGESDYKKAINGGPLTMLTVDECTVTAIYLPNEIYGENKFANIISALSNGQLIGVEGSVLVSDIKNINFVTIKLKDDFVQSYMDKVNAEAKSAGDNIVLNDVFEVVYPNNMSQKQYEELNSNYDLQISIPKLVLLPFALRVSLKSKTIPVDGRGIDLNSLFVSSYENIKVADVFGSASEIQKRNETTGVFEVVAGINSVGNYRVRLISNNKKYVSASEYEYFNVNKNELAFGTEGLEFESFETVPEEMELINNIKESVKFEGDIYSEEFVNAFKNSLSINHDSYASLKAQKSTEKGATFKLLMNVDLTNFTAEMQGLYDVSSSLTVDIQIIGKRAQLNNVELVGEIINAGLLDSTFTILNPTPDNLIYKNMGDILNQQVKRGQKKNIKYLIDIDVNLSAFKGGIVNEIKIKLPDGLSRSLKVVHFTKLYQESGEMKVTATTLSKDQYEISADGYLILRNVNSLSYFALYSEDIHPAAWAAPLVIILLLLLLLILLIKKKRNDRLIANKKTVTDEEVGFEEVTGNYENDLTSYEEEPEAAMMEEPVIEEPIDESVAIQEELVQEEHDSVVIEEGHVMEAQEAVKEEQIEEPAVTQEEPLQEESDSVVIEEEPVMEAQEEVEEVPVVAEAVEELAVTQEEPPQEESDSVVIEEEQELIEDSLVASIPVADEDDDDDDDDDFDEEDDDEDGEGAGATSEESDRAKGPKVIVEQKYLKEIVKAYYHVIKNTINQYPALKERYSKRMNSFSKGRKTMIRISVSSGTLRLYLRMDPKMLMDQYPVKDVSSKDLVKTTPTLLKIRSKETVQIGMKLIGMMLEGEEMTNGYKVIDYTKGRFPFSLDGSIKEPFRAKKKK